jgi:hypothetical protein
MWNSKTTGTISKPFIKHISNIPGKHKIKKYRKQSYWALHRYFQK